MENHNFKDMKSIKSTYQVMKKKGDKERIDFLDSIVSYCEFIGFNEEKTKLMLDLIRNILPCLGQSFIDCDSPDEIDIEYNKRFATVANPKKG